MNSATERKRKFLIDLAFAIAVVAIGYITVKYLLVWLLPFVIGLVVAICLQRPVSYLSEHTKPGRAFWSCLLVFAVLCVIFGILALLMWWIVVEAENLIPWIAAKVPVFKSAIDDFSTWVVNLSKYIPVDTSAALSAAPTMILDVLVEAITSFLTVAATKIITDGPGLLISSIFSVVASCYITKDYRKITNFILCQFTEKKQELIISVKRLFVTNILFMLRGYIIIMSITFLELFLGLTILGVNHAAVLAAMIAVLDILPVLGTGTVLIPWGVISLVIGNVPLGAGVLIMYLLITIIRNIIEPRIIGEQVGLPPIVTLVAMYLGLKVFGVIGMLLFPVVTIIIVKLQESGIIHIWNVPEYMKSHEEKKKKGFFRKKDKPSKVKKEKAQEASKLVNKL